MLKITCILFLLTASSAIAQFAGPAGSPGSTAMQNDSSAFIAWADSCVLQRGPQDITNPGLGLADFGDEISPIGISNALVVSLGDGGIAELSFNPSIIDGPGVDFAVFENSFSDSYLELAFVEVSSDGINFYRFPATSNTQTTTQMGPFTATGDATLLNNLAGKYRANFGTPFDLQELSGIPGLDLQNITKVRIIDVVGSISAPHSTFDQLGQAINDPFPTGFPSSGFDLESVGVIHERPAALGEFQANLAVRIFPNPLTAGQSLHIECETDIEYAIITAINGTFRDSWTESTHRLDGLAPGIYLLSVVSSQGMSTSKLIVH